MTRFALVVAAMLSLGLVGVSDFSVAAEGSGGCHIKGNVSTRGERIYHVPGQKYYDETRISASHGERWFCSELVEAACIAVESDPTVDSVGYGGLPDRTGQVSLDPCNPRLAGLRERHVLVRLHGRAAQDVELLAALAEDAHDPRHRQGRAAFFC